MLPWSDYLDDDEGKLVVELTVVWVTGREKRPSSVEGIRCRSWSEIDEEGVSIVFEVEEKEDGER